MLVLSCPSRYSVHPALPRGTLFQLGYGTHHWHSNSSSVCSRRHCLRDCHRTRRDSSLLFVRFEVSVYYYYFFKNFIPSVSRIPRDFGKKIDTKEKIVGVQGHSNLHRSVGRMFLLDIHCRRKHSVYFVPLMPYSTSNICVTLKSGLGSFEFIENGAVR